MLQPSKRQLTLPLSSHACSSSSGRRCCKRAADRRCFNCCPLLPAACPWGGAVAQLPLRDAPRLGQRQHPRLLSCPCFSPTAFRSTLPLSSSYVAVPLVCVRASQSNALRERCVFACIARDESNEWRCKALSPFAPGSAGRPGLRSNSMPCVPSSNTECANFVNSRVVDCTMLEER